jgi:phosphatidylglycerophosphatase A
MTFTRRIAVLFATGFGLGYSPIASGTFGTLPGILIAGAICGLNFSVQTVIAVLLPILAIPICSAAEKEFGTKDDGRVVADEYTTFPLTVLGIPWLIHPWLLGVAFVVHRVLDIIKPPPARQSQQLHGGVGIVMDDMISSLYALAVNHAIVRLLGLH